jgi:hypothetical protein
MDKTKVYRTNRFLAFVVILMSFALLFTVDIDRLLQFYKDIWSMVIVSFFGVISPLLILFGFSFKILPNEIISRSYFFSSKRFKINDLSHILYQPTWSGITQTDSETNMRSLHIVRGSGGWVDTISLANGPYKEQDLADIIKRLQRMNPRLEIDEKAKALAKKYDGKSQ